MSNYCCYSNHSLFILFQIKSIHLFNITNLWFPAMKEIWLQKYRPNKLNDVYGNEEIVSTLKSLVSQGNLPHMILSGPPGVGKTSSVLCAARQLLGDKFAEAYKQLNSSDQRGIDVVRDLIKNFARKKVNLPPGLTKIILLDQADSLTQGAMHALRMIMSNESETTRFILSCNNSSSIIEPIQSRCVSFRFNKLERRDLQKCMRKVMENQRATVTQKAFETMIFIADGDMRTAINNLQACHFASGGEKIDENTVLHICDYPSIQELKEIIKLCTKKDIKQALRRMHAVYQQGYSVIDITTAISKIVMGMEGQIPKDQLLEMLRYDAQLKRRVMDGLDSEIQLGKFLCNVSSLFV